MDIDLFDKQNNRKLLDDTETFKCTIENTETVGKHTEYIMVVQRGASKEDKWKINRRYKDFCTLNLKLLEANLELPFPPKKFIGNMLPSFVAMRKQALQNYIDEVLKHDLLSMSLTVRSFLDPKNYSSLIAEQALQTVSIALRGDGRYSLKSALPGIGWRIRKHYFLVCDTSTKTEYILSWQTYGPDKCLCDKDLQGSLKLLQSLRHPYIENCITVQNLKTGAYVVRKIYLNGSLRDMLYGTEYNKSFLSKYGNPKTRKPLTLGQISHYGHQILQALKFLHDKGLRHGHLHTGNIVVEDQRAILTDLENSMLGGANFHRPKLLNMRRISSSEAIDVYCFGHVLYEMAFAKTLEDQYCDIYPEATPRDLEFVLRACLSSSCSKHAPTTLDDLLHYPLFSQGVSNGFVCEQRLKIPQFLAEELRKAALVAENRLKADQKLVRNAKRETRIHEILNSTEELRKHQRRVKKHENAWKSTSSLAETARSSSAASCPAPAPPAPPTLCEEEPNSRPAAPGDVDRSALLGAICSFDRSRLARVHSR